MKFIIISIMLSVFAFSLDTVKWYSAHDAYNLSSKDNRTIMVVVYSDDCPYCHGYFNLLKENKDLNVAANNSVYQVPIDQKDASQIGLNDIQKVPAFLFFDKDMNECADPQYGIPMDIKVLINKIKDNCKK